MAPPLILICYTLEDLSSNSLMPLLSTKETLLQAFTLMGTRLKFQTLNVKFICIIQDVLTA